MVTCHVQDGVLIAQNHGDHDAQIELSGGTMVLVPAHEHRTIGIVTRPSGTLTATPAHAEQPRTSWCHHCNSWVVADDDQCESCGHRLSAQ